MSIIAAQSDLNRMSNDTNRLNFEKGQQNLGSSEIGKDGFMQLMLAQLKYQNPLEPMDNTEQLMQQAQFTQIEELQKLNSNLALGNQFNQATQLVGKTVDYINSSGQQLEGIIESAAIGDGTLGLSVNGETITPEQILQIKQPAQG